MKNNQAIQKLTLASTLLAIGVIMTSPPLATMITLFGIPAVRVDLFAIPIIIAGVLLGPVLGLGIGILTDVLGYLLFNHIYGPYHIGFTINLALTGLMSGIIYVWLTKKKTLLPMPVINILTLSILSISGIIYLLSTESIPVGSGFIPITALFKTIFILGIMLFYAVIVAIQWFSHKKKTKHFEHIDLFIFIVMLIEVVVGIILSSIWHEDIYGTPPFLIGALLRIMRAMWLIPIKVYLVFYITKVAFVVFGQNKTSFTK